MEKGLCFFWQEKQHPAMHHLSVSRRKEVTDERKGVEEKQPAKERWKKERKRG